MTDENTKPSAFNAWILAARPKTLAAAAVPVIVATSFTRADGVFNIATTLLCFSFAFLMQICANLVNDLLDFKKGADGEGRIGPKRACSQGWISEKSMRRGIFICAIVACLCGCGLLFYGGAQLIFVGLACLVFAYLYTGGPFPLSERALGDVAVVVFFGFVPVCFTYYVAAGTMTPEIFAAGAACGLVVDTLLILNNYRDAERDGARGKITTVVLFGKKAGSMMYLCAGIAACLICAFFYENLWGALLPQLYLPLHAATWCCMTKSKTAPEFGAVLAQTSRNMLVFGLLLGIGITLPAPW